MWQPRQIPYNDYVWVQWYCGEEGQSPTQEWWKADDGWSLSNGQWPMNHHGGPCLGASEHGASWRVGEVARYLAVTGAVDDLRDQFKYVLTLIEGSEHVARERLRKSLALADQNDSAYEIKKHIKEAQLFIESDDKVGKEAAGGAADALRETTRAYDMALYLKEDDLSDSLSEAEKQIQKARWRRNRSPASSQTEKI